MEEIKTWQERQTKGEYPMTPEGRHFAMLAEIADLREYKEAVDKHPIARLLIPAAITVAVIIVFAALPAYGLFRIIATFGWWC